MMDILQIFNPPVYENSVSIHLFKSFKISLSGVLYFLM